MQHISYQRRAKVRFYTKSLLQQLFVPAAACRARLGRKLETAGRYDPQLAAERLDYCCRLTEPFRVSSEAVRLRDLPRFRKSAYYNDYYSILRYFPQQVRADLIFGDVRKIPTVPTLVKSRLISDTNQNSVLLKLNSVRHFLPINDTIPFEQKKNQLVWRGAVWRRWRKAFIQQYINHPLCDVGQVNRPDDGTPPEWVKSKLSIQQQLQYKFILSIEGNDVATNLKWIAQSNSLCFMKKPTCETWMMEGRLQGGVHYVELQEDYSDLPEKLEYYLEHTDEALQLIANFKAYYAQFTDSALEELLQLLVVQKYLTLAGQIPE